MAFLLLAALWSVLNPFENIHLATERSVVQSEPLMVSVRLPEGWSIIDDQVVPGLPLRGACQIHTSMYGDSDWNAALAPTVRDAATERVLERLGGHVAVEARKHSASSTQETVFINLDDVRPNTFEVWSVESDSSAEGRQCKVAFEAMLGTIRVR